MKTRKHIIRQTFVLLLLVILQVTGLVHLATMPRLTGADRRQASSIDFLHKNHSTNAPRVQFQRSFHTDLTRRRNITAPPQLLLLFYAGFLLAPFAFTTFKRTGDHSSDTHPLSFLSYLSLRKLRI
ncbi:hypothetical protein ACFJIV_05795 [Mucilaginibacter sp. UC70_90]